MLPTTGKPAQVVRWIKEYTRKYEKQSGLSGCA
jgi:hypothetical protein